MSDISFELKREAAQYTLVRIIAIMQKHKIDYMDLDEELRTAITEVFQFGVGFIEEFYANMGKDVS